MARVLDASVVTATCGRPALLRDLARSLGAQSWAAREWIVVDDGGRDPVDERALTALSKMPVRVLRNETPVGPGAARGLGVHRSRGSHLLFTDDDCIVAPEWAESLVAALERGDSWLGGVGGRVRARDRDVVSRYFEFHRVLEPVPHDSTNPERIPYLVTANCAVHRDVYMRAGGFDGRIPAAGGEDAALSMRIAKLGYHFERAPRALVHHRFRRGLREFAKTFYRYGLGGRYVVDRYLPL